MKSLAHARLVIGLVSIVSFVTIGGMALRASPPARAPDVATAQVPAWSDADMDFFLHGSMSTEMVPERVLRAFIKGYPDLFPSADLSHLGLITDEKFGWPIGFSRSRPKHLGKMSSVGVNCAVCHVAEIESSSGSTRVRVIGVTSHFDAEAFFNAVIAATYLSEDPANLKKFFAAYVESSDREALEREWDRQQQQIATAIADDPAGVKGAGEGGLQALTACDLELDGRMLADGKTDLPGNVRSMLKLFHNMRAALHVPDQPPPPEKLPPPSGPGRNDAFGLLSFVLFNAPQPHAPVKYGLVWNLQSRRYVHWDGNTQSPIGRNLLASLGLGAPLIGKHGELDFAMVQRQTDLSERILSPRYPWAIDRDAASRGAAHYLSQCASCHDGPEGDGRLYAIADTGTDSTRAANFTPLQADRFDKFLAELETAGYNPPSEPGIRSTQKYWAPTLSGVWARSPYLHNGSVRTMRELLTAPDARAKSFHRGSRVYDANAMGYADDGPFLLDTTKPGDSNAGHDYGTSLTDEQKRELIEYLKTL